VLVVGTVTVLRPGNDSPVLAQARPAVGPVVVATAPAAEQSVVEEPVVADVRMIRDAQLDRYLTAHKQFAGTSALGVPSAFLRSATLDTASR
jgi:sigma-E factor negative regulatory protein RseA